MSKRKRMISMVMSAAMAAGLLAGCAGNTPVAETEASAAAAGEKEIYMFVSCPENADAIANAIEEYKKVAPNITINYETTQSDYPTLLKAKMNSGDTPDIFASTGGQEMKAYAEYSYDLSGQPLASSLTDSAKATMTYEDKLLGIPVISNAFGMMYNQELFDQAGISAMPATFTELEAACEKLSAAGIQPFTNGYKEWWVYKYVFQNFIDVASEGDPEALVQSFIDGTAKVSDYPVLAENYFDYVDLTVKYGDAKPLETDLNAEITAFSTGKAAMMTGIGAPMEPSVKAISPEMKISFCGYQVDENPEHFFIVAGAEQAYRVNKDSKVLNETLDFLNWLYCDYGKTWFPEVMNAIPPIGDTPLPNTDVAAALTSFMETREPGVPSAVYSLDSFHQKFGEIMQSYVAGSKTREEAVKEIEQQWTELGAIE